MDFSRWKFCNFSGLNLGKGGFRQISFQTNSSENFQTGHLKVHIICSHFVFKVKTSGGFNAICWGCQRFANHTKWNKIGCVTLDLMLRLSWTRTHHSSGRFWNILTGMRPQLGKRCDRQFGKRCNRQIGKKRDRQINFGHQNSTKDTENWIGLEKTELNSLTAV